MTEGRLWIDASHALRMSDVLHDLREPRCGLSHRHGGRLPSAGVRVLEAHRGKQGGDVVPQPGLVIVEIRYADNHAPHREALSPSLRTNLWFIIAGGIRAGQGRFDSPILLPHLMTAPFVLPGSMARGTSSR